MHALRPYQELSRDWLSSPLPAGEVGRVLGDGPRCGKTFPAIDAAVKLGARRVNVIAPASVTGNWLHYAAERAPGVKFTATSFDKSWRVEIPKGDVLIVDEAHALKSPETKRTLGVYGAECERGGWAGSHAITWALSGTLTPNYSCELWTHMRRLASNRILTATGRPMNYHQFRDRYCEMWDNGFSLVVRGNKNTPELRERLKGFVLRRTWADVSSQVKPSIDMLRLTAKWPAGLDKEVKRVADAYEKGGVAALAALKPRPGADENEVMGALARMRRAIGLSKVLPVLDVIESSVRSGEKVALYAAHTEVLDGLEAGFQKWGVGYERIDGAVPQGKRAERARRFREDPRCVGFIGQNIAAGAGIDLSSADWLILLELDFSPGVTLQIVDRVLNIAKTRPVTVNCAVITGTIDEQLAAANIRKLTGINQLNAA